MLAEFAHAVGAMEKRPGGDISLIAVTATGQPADER